MADPDQRPGGGPVRPAEDEPQFVLASASPRRRELLARAGFRFLVVPSRAEAMPYIILETVAAQRPLIATRVGGIPEVFGKYADRLIEPGHIGKLTVAMENALSEPERMAADAKELRSCLAETFSVELMSDRITTLYQELKGLKPQEVSVSGAKETVSARARPQSVYARSSNR